MLTFLVALVVGTSGCAHRFSSLHKNIEVVTEAGAYELRFEPQDTWAASRIGVALEKLSPRLVKWGGLRERVTLYILPTHEALEDAVNRRGYDWLRAWARYDEIFVQSPRTWFEREAPLESVMDLLLHELVHCSMYQHAATRDDWSRKGIPLWFREGMASFSAMQGARWPGPESLARFYDAHPGQMLGTNIEGLYQHDSDVVYGSAHQAFAFLHKRYGDERIRALLATMRRGEDFPDAFKATMGIPAERFLAEFERYLRMRGFRDRESTRGS